MRLVPDENASLFSGRNFDLTGDERIHFKLYRRQQIDTGLRYMDGDNEAVARFRIIAVQSTSCVPPALPSGQAVWLWAREGQSLRRRYVIDVCIWKCVSALCQKQKLLIQQRAAS